MHDAASLQAKVSRLRQIIADAIPTPTTPSAAETDAWQRYQHFAANQPVLAIDLAPNAKKIRAINRIAVSYGWVSELQRMLDQYDASTLGALNDEEIDAVHQRMATLEACVQGGFDPPDAPPAR